MMNVNLRSVFHLMQLAVPHLERRQGNIVNVSSVTGLRAFPGVLAYCVSKAGVDQLTRCAALELAGKKTRSKRANPAAVGPKGNGAEVGRAQGLNPSPPITPI